MAAVLLLPLARPLKILAHPWVCQRDLPPTQHRMSTEAAVTCAGNEESLCGMVWRTVAIQPVGRTLAASVLCLLLWVEPLGQQTSGQLRNKSAHAG
eukprot:5017412-Amphidinium_carterae.2